jgi:protein-S-isoprenylcysteine O-methyltransferase Ste14
MGNGVTVAKYEVRIQPPQMFLIQVVVILAQWAFGVWLLPELRTPPSATPLGWALFLPCVVAFLVGKMWMFKFFAKYGASPMFKEHAKELITKFPFSAARNPFYLLDLLPFLGLTLLLGTLDPLLLHGPLFFLFLALYIVPKEEKRLLLAHGTDYEDYKSRVKRWGLF